MKNLIISAIMFILSFNSFSQTSYLYESTPLGTSLSAYSTTSSLTGTTSYYTPDNIGNFNVSAYSTPNIGGGSTLYSQTQMSVGNFSVDVGYTPTSYSTPSYGGSTTIYSPTSLNIGDINVNSGYTPTTVITPNFSGTYSVYSNTSSGSTIPSGYYNTSTGQGYISIPSSNLNVNIYSSSY